jgi:hypothetical protein
MSVSEISVPIESSAAALRVASRSSGRMVSNEVVEQLVRKPRSEVEGEERESEGALER